jgi:hypothetical protein
VNFQEKCPSEIPSTRGSPNNPVGRVYLKDLARLTLGIEYRYHWADVIVNTTYMNDVMRAVCVIPGLFSFLEWYKTDHMKKTLYRHAEYATEHTEAYVLFNIFLQRELN